MARLCGRSWWLGDLTYSTPVGGRRQAENTTSRVALVTATTTCSGFVRFPVFHARAVAVHGAGRVVHVWGSDCPRVEARLCTGFPRCAIRTHVRLWVRRARGPPVRPAPTPPRLRHTSTHRAFGGLDRRDRSVDRRCCPFGQRGRARSGRPSPRSRSPGADRSRLRFSGATYGGKGHRPRSAGRPRLAVVVAIAPRSRRQSAGHGRPRKSQ